MVEKDSKQAAEDLVLIRQKIDAVDKQIQELINERARYAKQIGEAKIGRAHV